MTPGDSSSGSVRHLYAAIWRHAEDRRGRIILVVVLLAVAQAIRLTVPWFFGLAVNAVQGAGTAGLTEAARYLAFMLVAVAVAWVLHGPARIVERFTGLTVRERFADALYAKAISLPVRWHEQHHSGDTIYRMSKASTSLSNFAQTQFIYIQNTVSIVGPIFALLLVSRATGIAAFVGYAVLGLFVVRIDRVMVRLVQEENRAERRYNSALVDSLGNVATVLTLRLQAATRSTLARRLAEVFAPLRRNIVFNEVKWAGIDFLNNGMRTGLVALYAWLEWRQTGLITVGTAVMVHQYSQQVGTVVAAMAMHWNELVRQKTDVAGVDDLLAAPSSAPSGAPIPEGWREIRVEGLRVSHPQSRSAAPALDGASLVLRRGQRLALVGESGAGKSSLLRALSGLVEADQVSFHVDGKPRPDLRHLGPGTLLLPQDPEVFEASVLDNLTLGVPRPPEQVQAAIRMAGFEPVVAQLPQGLETIIRERGLNLSGGQKQRLALARGLLAAQGTGLVLLDEPTSSIDAVTESAIYDGILTAFAGACVVASVHRLHLLTRFDQVVLLEHGRVVDTGALSELLRRQPAFRALWTAQVGAHSGLSSAA